MQTLTALNREQGVTIIVVTHEPDIAAYADRVLTMRDGQIISDERKRKSVAAPARSVEPAIADASRKPAPSAGQLGAIWAFALMVMAAALQAINRNKMRSSLTMLGVFIGVAALIAMVAVGQGANEAVRKQIASLGTNLFVVLPGATTTGGVRGGLGSASTLTVGDAQAIQREAPSVRGVSYLIRQSGQVQYSGQNWTTGIQGVSPNYPPMTNWQIANGRSISDDDMNQAALVVVLGQTRGAPIVRRQAEPGRRIVQVKGVPLRVIGILAAKGQSQFGTDQDDLVMIPFSTAERKVLGVAAPTQTKCRYMGLSAATESLWTAAASRRFRQSIYVQAMDQSQVQPAVQEVTQTLARRHRIKPGDVNDFSVRNLSQIAETAESSSRIMAILLAAVASISLLVGGIGIMNILLVSVTERTREIGLRMAIGARRLHVLLQFLAEAVFLSVTGGIAGIIMGSIFSLTISAIFGWAAPISLTAIAGGFLFSAAVGIFFGYYPARKAAHLDPIEALRYE